MYKLWVMTLVATALLASAPGAGAQLFNEPYSFNGNGLGLSTAARQAIINHQVYGQTPDHLLVAPDGSLLSVTRGPGHNVIVSTQGGVVLPDYRGRGLDLGGFAPFFESGANNGFSNGAIAFYSNGTSATISGWTFGLIAEGKGRFTIMPPASPSSIDMWTAQVSGLSL